MEQQLAKQDKMEESTDIDNINDKKPKRILHMVVGIVFSLFISLVLAIFSTDSGNTSYSGIIFIVSFLIFIAILYLYNFIFNEKQQKLSRIILLIAGLLIFIIGTILPMFYLSFVFKN